jgi:hypothetical protein
VFWIGARDAVCATQFAITATRPRAAIPRRSCYKAAKSTPITTARRNLAQRIANLFRKAGGGELNPTPWQLSQMREAIEQLEEERFGEGERTMSEAERYDLHEPTPATLPTNR